ncbi:unnamed protein product [Symbiodinium sp. KB8]|nr:unnamed protein product [Symbiodinium sp. KB8]
MAFIVWPLQTLAAMPALGVGVALVAGFAGSYDLTYRTAAWAYPVKAKVTSFSNYLGGTSGVASAALVWYLREKLLLPKAPPAPAIPSDGPIMHRLGGALSTAKHAIVHYPYQFRLTSVLVTGIAGGLAHLHVQRSWLHRDLNDGAADFLEAEAAAPEHSRDTAEDER